MADSPVSDDFQDPTSYNGAWHPQAVRNGELPYSEMQRIEVEGVGDPQGSYDVVNGVFVPASGKPVKFPLGSPTNWWLCAAHEAQGRNDLQYVHPAHPEYSKEAIWGASWWEWQDERDGYLYQKLDQGGSSVPATMDEILGFIGRSFAQEG